MSYIRAVGHSNIPITYFLNSTHLYVDETNGEVFLIAKLAYDTSNPNNFEVVTIGATNGASQIYQTNKISIINANKSPPEFVTTQRIFEIEEVPYIWALYLLFVLIYIHTQIYFTNFKRTTLFPLISSIKMALALS